MRLSHPTLRHTLATAIVALLGVHSAFAQSSPLESKVRSHVGFEAGISMATQKGIYRAGCGEFDNGSGTGPIIALAYDGPLATGLRYEALLGFHRRTVTGSYMTEDPTEIMTSDGVRTALIQFEQRGTLATSSIFLLPSVRYSIVPWLYVGAGASVGVSLSTTTEYSQEILTRTVDAGSGLTEVFFDATESSDRHVKIDPTQDRSDAGSLLLDGVFYAGADIRVADNWTAGPRVMYSLPLGNVFSDPVLSISSLQIMLGVRRTI